MSGCFFFFWFFWGSLFLFFFGGLLEASGTTTCPCHGVGFTASAGGLLVAAISANFAHLPVLFHPPFQYHNHDCGACCHDGCYCCNGLASTAFMILVSLACQQWFTHLRCYPYPYLLFPLKCWRLS